MITNSASSRKTNGARGATGVLEMVVAFGIASLVLLAMSSISYFTARGFVALGNYADLDRASQRTLDQMTRDIRGSSYLISSTSNQLVFNYADSTNLTFTWDPAAGTLTRSKTGEPDRLLLGHSDSLLLNPYTHII